MRCPTCSATNPDSATFCGQCYERFSSTPPAVGPASAPTPDPTPAAAPSAVVGPAGTGAGGQPVAVGRFASTDAGLEWRCAVCESTHPVGVFVCGVCGARMDAEAPDPDASPVDWEGAKRLEAVVPGLGHLRTGHGGMGASRLGIAVVWVLGSLLLASGGGPSGLLTAAPLLIGLAVVWATGPGDLDAARAGRPPRLDARRFMYVVIAATTGVIVAGGLAVLL